jgi:SNF2 family DNA or RNA helicase
MWAVLHFLYPQHFKSYWKFIGDNYITVRQTNETSGQTYIDVVCLKPGRDIWIQKTLQNISTNRKRRDPEVMPWLPDKDYQKIRLPMTNEQRTYIHDLETVWETEHIVTKGILDRLMRYRQICLSPELLDLKGSSPKLDWVDQYLLDYPDTPVLIFSQFTQFLKMIYAKHQECGIIIGETPLKKREQLRQAFQKGRINCLLINTQAGGVALTLDRAECAIFTDKYPPIGDITQAEDRFVATTKDKAMKPHLIIELMMRDSYDEHIYQMLSKNQTETDIINNYKIYLERRSQHA